MPSCRRSTWLRWRCNTKTATVTVRRMQRRKAKNNSKAATTASGLSGGKANGRVTLLDEPFPPKDSGMHLYAAVLLPNSFKDVNYHRFGISGNST